MRCLYCYQPLTNDEVDFHSSCSKKIFDQPTPPTLPYSEADMDALAGEILKTQMAVTGVQAKISLNLDRPHKNEPKRFAIVGLWGSFILKPTSLQYPYTSEVEDLTMHLAAIAHIPVVPHSLIRLQSGQLAYITKRIDRDKNSKIHLEDLCQLSEMLTEHKYRSSYEKVAKVIAKYSTNPGLDVVNFFEQVLFSFLVGNADMHLKNFSLLHDPHIGPILSPAYDMLATALVNPDDKEELALTLNGKKNQITYADFKMACSSYLDEKQLKNIVIKMEKALPRWIDFINISFLTEDYKIKLIELIRERFKRLSRN